MKTKATIQDVAKKAGVSVTTVSFALNGKGRISQKTKEMIQAAVEELGFIKNRNAASLRQTHSSLIGLVFDQPLNDFFSLVFSEVEQQLFTQNKHTFFCKVNHHSDLIKKLSVMIEMGCDGVILCLQETILEEAINFLLFNDLPFVVISQAKKREDKRIITSNNYQMSQMATFQLLESGHKRIAYLGGQMDSMLRLERLSGYIESMMNQGLSFYPEFVQDEHQLQHNDHFEQFIAKYPSVSGFICHDKKTALALYVAAIKRGKKFNLNKNDHYFNNSIEIVSFDCDDFSVFQDFPIHWINANVHEITKEAILLLNQEINHHTN